MPDLESKIKKIDFLKVVGSNPDRKVTEIAKEFGMGQTYAYNAINEFTLNYVWTDGDPDFPARLLAYYNKDIPNKDEHLTQDIPNKVEQLKHYRRLL